jgi:hypothetical protein
MAGKGDSPRPVDGEKYRQNYDKIFPPKREKPIDFVSMFVHKCPYPEATPLHLETSDER